MPMFTRRLWSAMHLGGLSVREVAIRTWTKINEHEVLTRAAAITFYAIAALVPFLALVITLAAYFLPWIAPAAGSGGAGGVGPAGPPRRPLSPGAAPLLAPGPKPPPTGPPPGPLSFRVGGAPSLSSGPF